MILEVIESNILEKGHKIKLNYLGLELNGGEAHYNTEHIHLTRFGTGKLDPLSRGSVIESDISSRKLVDYELPYEENLMPRHFDIKFDLNTNKYCARDFKNSGLFVKIISKHVSLL